MRGVYLSFICLALAISSCHSQADPQFPNIKSLIQNGFMTRVEISGRPKESTFLVEEFYSVSDKVTKVKTLKEGHRQTVVLNAKHKQVAVIENNTCEVLKYQNNALSGLSLDPSWLYLYSEEQGGEMFYGPTSILRRASEFQPRYMERTSVRGMDCHRFEGTDANRGVEIDFFFTADWTTPFNVSAKVLLPVQIQVMLSGEQEAGIQFVDFFYFVPSITNPTLLEVPYGIGCKGLKGEEVEMPATPKRYTMSGELFSATDTPIDMDVKTFRVWYDYEAQLARVDTYTKDTRGVSKVLDYNTGVMYVTRDSQECVAIPIEDGSFDEITGDLRLVMKDPDASMNMKGDFYYLGKQTTRGIFCDVWEMVAENVVVDKLTVNRMVYTHFLSSHWWEVNVDGELEEQVPVRLEINTYLDATEPPTTKTVFNFFRFRKHPALAYSPFSIINCASDISARNYVGIFIDADEDSARNAESQAPVFRELVQNKIIEVASISPIRLPFTRVDYEPGSITIMALILERAPAMAQFVKLDDGVPKSKESKREKIKSEELCAEECIKSEVCVGFHYCAGKGDCYISVTDWSDDWGADVKSAGSCTLYKRQEAGSQFKDVLLKDALANLKQSVSDGKFVIEIRVKDDTVEYKASEFLDDVTPVTGGDHDKDMFSRMIGQKKFKSSKDDQTTENGGEVLSASDCYRKCKTEKNIACSSFSFCTDTNECLLSPILVLPGKKYDDSLDSSPMCAVYSINYLQMFDEYKGSARISPGKEAVSADSASECAKSCRQKGEKVCRGFDYCGSKKQCVFHEKHVLDFEGTDKDMTNVGSGCSHYALKYSADFVEMGRFVLSDPNSKSVSSVSVEDCAKMCSENMEFKCRSFDFCKSDDDLKMKCTLNTLTVEDDVKSDDSDTCQHYAKKDGLVDDYSTQQLVKKQSDTSGYSPGGLASLIIGMIILGIAIGVIGFFAYSYVRKSRMTDGTAVKFVNQ